MTAPALHKVWRLGADVDTDALAPGHSMKYGIDRIASYCLEALRPEFAGFTSSIALATPATRSAATIVGARAARSMASSPTRDAVAPGSTRSGPFSLPP